MRDDIFFRGRNQPSAAAAAARDGRQSAAGKNPFSVSSSRANVIKALILIRSLLIAVGLFKVMEFTLPHVARASGGRESALARIVGISVGIIMWFIAWLSVDPAPHLYMTENVFKKVKP